MKKIFILVFVPFFILLLTSCESYSNYEQIYFNQENDFLEYNGYFYKLYPRAFYEGGERKPIDSYGKVFVNYAQDEDKCIGVLRNFYFKQLGFRDVPEMLYCSIEDSSMYFLYTYNDMFIRTDFYLPSFSELFIKSVSLYPLLLNGKNRTTGSDYDWDDRTVLSFDSNSKITFYDLVLEPIKFNYELQVDYKFLFRLYFSNYPLLACLSYDFHLISYGEKIYLLDKLYDYYYPISDTYLSYFQNMLYTKK